MNHHYHHRLSSPFRHLNRILWVVLSLLLLASVTCGLPAQGLNLDEQAPPGFDFSDLGGGAENETMGMPQESPLKVQAEFTPPEGKTPGYLIVTVKLEPGWHIYSMMQAKPAIATEIKVKPSEAVKRVGTFAVSPAPKRRMDPGFNIMVENHDDTVTWLAPLELGPGVDLSTLEIKGSVYAQACKDSCIAPEDYPFTAKQAANPGQYAKLIATASSKTGSTDGGFNLDSINGAGDKGGGVGSLWWNLGLAFLGGLILNIMPCVLPVIGLKILSFLEQAGKSRSHALMLNVWYSLGLMSVFLFLAVLAIFWKVGWGGLFRYGGMNLALTAVVFVMALSFLGTWEIPIPGFVGSGKAEVMSRKEGAIGAFVKGILTTILATPCSAPLLASALTWAVIQPPAQIFAVFTFIGLGMASPYLLIGAFPALIRFLPKPGEWMETFKQAMGFVLLATVIFLLTSTAKDKVVPTITFLFGLWAACWWIGKINVLAPARIKLLYWCQAIAFSIIVWMFSFLWLGSKAAYELPWQPYTNAGFAQHMEEKRTILVDFTADWCTTCKWFETAVLNTKNVYDTVKKHNVVTLKGDWSRLEESTEVDEMLGRLGPKQVPVILIIPHGDVKKKTIFRASYTQDGILNAISPVQAEIGTTVPISDPKRQESP